MLNLVVHIVTVGLKGLKQPIEYLGLYLELFPVTEDDCRCVVIFNHPGSCIPKV